MRAKHTKLTLTHVAMLLYEINSIGSYYERGWCELQDSEYEGWEKHYLLINHAYQEEMANMATMINRLVSPYDMKVVLSRNWEQLDQGFYDLEQRFGLTLKSPPPNGMPGTHLLAGGESLGKAHDLLVKLYKVNQEREQDACEMWPMLAKARDEMDEFLDPYGLECISWGEGNVISTMDRLELSNMYRYRR